MFKVFVTRRLPPIAKKILAEKFRVHSSERNEPLPRDVLYSVVADYDAVLSTVTERFDRDILKNKVKLRAISNYGAGLDNIDLEYASSVGVNVYNTPDVVTNSTADLTLSIFLALVRKINSAQQFIRQNEWKTWDPEIFLGEELSGKNFGIWGLGKIGLAVAKRASGFGMNIIYHNRNELSSAEKIGFKYVELEELLATSDYLSIHLPLTEETKDVVDRNIISKMRKKPIILNMARGDIVVTRDLVEALKKGDIRGAALDVTSPEPISGNHELCSLENCLVVPHIGTATKECRLEMARLAAENIVNHFGL